MTPVEELREAARLMRERANAATPGPWESLDDGDRLVAWKLTPDGQFDDDFEYVADEPIGNAANAEYIASMHPGVALALAELLEQEADDLEADHLPIWRDLLDDAGIAQHIEESKHFGPLFRLARAYLGGAR